MEFGVILDALADKSIFITGSTGFIGKILVEKVLRVQPTVKKLYVHVRASDTTSAVNRYKKEVIETDLFSNLRQKYGEKFNSFIEEKVSPIPGDVIHVNLGIEDINARELLWKDINMVIHLAATTYFNDRYDASLNINVLGAKHAMNFAKRCNKLDVFLHVSTAFVYGEKEGVLLENALSWGETLKGNIHLNVEAEIKLVEQCLKELQHKKPSMEDQKVAMKELGMKRAQHFGWPNTYVFTKAMAEILLGKLRGNFPLVIARPTIITSTWKEPFPGWIEGARTIDSVIVGYAKGNFPFFPADFKSPMDLIPGDMVVNAMIAMAVAHSNDENEIIYHISSSVRNPVKYSSFVSSLNRYFSEHPMIGKSGVAIWLENFYIIKSLVKFRAFIFVRYRLPIEMLRLVNVIFSGLFSTKYNEINRKYKFFIHLAELLIPYSFFKGSFDDINLERLRMTTKKHVENNIFYFDPKDIDWEDYLYNIHIPGVIKYSYK